MIKPWKAITCITFLTAGIALSHIMFYRLNELPLTTEDPNAPWTPYAALLILGTLASLRLASWSIKGISWIRRQDYA